MIKDPTKLQQLRDEWKFAVSTQNRTRVTMGFYQDRADGAYFDHFLNLIHELVLTFVFSVLQDTLEQLRREGVFKCKGNALWDLMDASQSKMHWLDFAFINEGRDKRNKLVHHQEVPKREDTWKYIDALKKN